MSGTVVAVVAAGAALAGAIVTGTIQFATEKSRRTAERADRSTEWRRELYLRYLRFISHVPQDVAENADDVTASNELVRLIGRRLNDFRVEFLLYGSPTVRGMSVQDMSVAWQQFFQERSRLLDEESRLPEHVRRDDDAISEMAFGTTMWPLVERLSEAMRKELGV